MRKVYELIEGVGQRRLDFLMTDQNVTATALGKAAGYEDHSYIARMRKGTGTSRRVKGVSAEAIAQHLHCEVDYLFTEVHGRTQRTIGLPATSQTVVRAGAA